MFFCACFKKMDYLWLRKALMTLKPCKHVVMIIPLVMAIQLVSSKNISDPSKNIIHRISEPISESIIAALLLFSACKILLKIG